MIVLTIERLLCGQTLSLAEKINMFWSVILSGYDPDLEWAAVNTTSLSLSLSFLWTGWVWITYCNSCQEFWLHCLAKIAENHLSSTLTELKPFTPRHRRGISLTFLQILLSSTAGTNRKNWPPVTAIIHSTRTRSGTFGSIRRLEYKSIWHLKSCDSTCLNVKPTKALLRRLLHVQPITLPPLWIVQLIFSNL